MMTTITNREDDSVADLPVAGASRGPRLFPSRAVTVPPQQRRGDRRGQRHRRVRACWPSGWPVSRRRRPGGVGVDDHEVGRLARPPAGGPGRRDRRCGPGSRSSPGRRRASPAVPGCHHGRDHHRQRGLQAEHARAARPRTRSTSPARRAGRGRWPRSRSRRRPAPGAGPAASDASRSGGFTRLTPS